MKNKFGNPAYCLFLFCLSFFLLYVSCSNNAGHNTTNAENSKGKNTVHSKVPSSFSDTVIVNFPSAVFYSPDSLQLEKIKAVTDTMIFDSNMHDCYYQMRYSRIVLQKYWPQIKIVEIKNVRFILFKLANGSRDIIDLNTQYDPCGVFLFDGHKKAQLADMTNIDTELGFYFSR